MNNCIGVRNAKYFVGFLIITSIMCCFGAAMSFFYVFWNILTDSVAYTVACEYAAMFYVSLGLLIIGLLLLW